MPDNSTFIAISAFSGLAGALLTQTLTGLFGYFSEKRKYHNEHKNLYKSRKSDIGENFYYMTGERMAIISKNITYWKNWNNSRSETSLEFLNKEMVKLNNYLEKLDNDNWKFNLISLYFNVSLTNDNVITSNAKSKQLYLRVLDVIHQLKNTAGPDKEELYKRYAIALFDMCAHYEELYLKMQQDMNLIKAELLQEYATHG
ncbi:MAG: hypothetical protein ACHQHN_08165 [Sphingobacteriales bacterium]